jgi:DNA-binding SARP family transcriptional activator/type II secretory pathway predicted ATPase ExeA/tetratricopeptide (TPR) repeat protein
MAPLQHLRCMGVPVLYSAYGDPIKFRTKKHLALLVYLTLDSSSSHRRDKLSELLWPRASIAEARHSLATALSVLRAKLGPEALRTTRDNVSLSRDCISTDLESLLSKGASDDLVGSSYEIGRFLDGFDIPDAPEFTLWKDRQQARWLPHIRATLTTQFDHCRRTGQSTHIEHLADRLLLLDDLSEEAIRAKMEGRAMAGDRLTALRVYEEWSTRMWTELKASPSEAIEQLALRLRRGGWERAVVTDIREAQVEHGRYRAFVGRAKEFALLYDVWELLKQGRSTHVMLVGDSGVGKTTLVERFTNAASLEGAAVCRVQAYDIERSIPFATLGSLINILLDQPGALGTPAEALAELGKAVPGIKRRFTALPDADNSQGESARIRLTDAFQELMKSVAEEHPLVLVIDDLHLADEASLAVLHLVLRRSSSSRVVAVFIARDEEITHSPQATALKQSLARLQGRVIVLQPFEEKETEELLNSLLGTEEPHPSSRERRALVRSSGGVPMVLELLIHDWRCNGAAAVALSIEAMTTDLPGPFDTQLAYSHVMARIAGRIDPVARKVLEFASVLGRRLNDLSMYSVIDLSLGQTMAALGQLCELRLLREGDTGLAFTNEVVRAHTYSTLTSPVRRALHASVADRLLHSPQAQGAVAGLEIAWHSMRAGRVTDAIPYLLDGAATSVHSGAPQAAEVALASALASLSGQDRVDATFLLIEALQEQGRWQESLEVANGLVQGAAGEREEELFALVSMARGRLGMFSAPELADLIPRLTGIVLSCSHQMSRLRAANAAGHAVALLRDEDAARQLLDQMATIPSEGLEVHQRGLYGLTKSMLLYQAGELDASFAEASTTVGDLRSRNVYNSLAARLHWGMGSIRCRQGLYEAAVGHVETGLTISQAIGNDSLTREIAGNLAIYLGRLGRTAEQYKCAQEHLRNRVPGVFHFVDLQLAYCLAIAAARLGRAREGRQVLAESEAQLPESQPGWFVQCRLFWKADALLICGFEDEAKDAAVRAINQFDGRLESQAFAGCYARWMALLRTDAEAMQAVEDLFSKLERYDKVDQIEILCSKALLWPCQRSVLLAKVHEDLRNLPSCTWLHLRELGVRL